MDALEMVGPEDWPLVLSNLYRALKPKGYVYCTVEIAAEQDLENAFAAGQQAGLPVVYGEWAQEGFYPYYPTIEQVKDWVQQAGFHLIDETVAEEYHHFLVQKYEACKLPQY
jgi:cyclopropane fatty-acyl-phospholipid synthase-like methyltransferase